MMIRSIAEISKRSTKKCYRTACQSKESICWHPHNNQYYCVDCADSIEMFNGKLLERPKVKCGHCKEDDLRFLGCHVAMCLNCHKKTEIPSHLQIVKSETKEMTDKMLSNITGLNELLNYSEEWQDIFDSISDLQNKVDALC